MATALSLKDRLLGLVKRYGQSAHSIVQATLAVVPGAAALAPLIDHAFQQLEHAAQEHWEDKLLELTQANRQQLEQSLRLLELLDERFAVLLAHAQDAARRGQDIEHALRHLLQHDRDLQHGLEHLTDRLDGKLDAQMDSLRHIQEQLQRLLDARQVPTAAEAAPGISIANEAELAFLQQAKTMFRNAPAGLVSRQQWAALGDALAGAGDWAAAQQAHAQAAVAARHALDRTAEAEAAYKQFKDAAEAADWSAAHAALLRAIELDPQRFRPTPEHYVIEAVLGAGSFGVVLKCRNPISFDWDGNEELLAVKTFHESDLARPVKDLFLEANALKQLSHPNIIGVREFGYVGGVGKRPYLAMEYFEGQTLQAKLDRDGPLAVADFLAIFESIAAALHFAHGVGGGKRPIIHRDLKPANVLIRRQQDGWQVKVIDFGLAVPARLHAASLTKPQGMRSTRERTITGTIKYAPPEQLGERAYPIGPWSDVYAFGMTALESVLGTVRPQTRHWKRLPEEVRDGLRELLERCVDEEYDAADASNGRWHSFEPILAGLRQLKGGTADAHRQAKAKLQGADDPTNDRHSPGEPFVPIAEPRKLFKAAQLRCFVECGGYDGLLSPAKMSAFNSQDECFVSIFPGKQRVYRFDLFGALCEKFRSNASPLCIAWNEERCEYLISFSDRRIRRFNARLEAVGSLTVPDQFEPRLLVCGDGYVYVSDMGERIVRLGLQDGIQHQIVLSGKVCHLAFAKVQRYLIASTPNRLISLNPDLRILWSVDHFASQSTVTTSVSGDIWVALSSGHLWRLDNDSRKLVDVSIPPNVRALAALEKAIVVGTIQGQIQLYDTLGQKVGHDDLQTALYHICATEGELLVLSTARGPTVVKPLPELTLRTRQHAVREQALASLLEWERLAQSDVALHRVLEGYIQRLDLTRWQEVCALQLQFKERMRLQPAVYGKIEEALRFIDPQKAIRICQKTKPVIIDGSNVSRYHWKHESKGKKQARLAAILHIRDKLASETNPVFYPLIVVVDVTERHYTDDLASLKRMIDNGEILETPSAREADALILNLIRVNGWQDCRIVSNDRRLFDTHAEMLPGADQGWYELVRMAFTINPRTHEVYFPERSAR